MTLSNRIAVCPGSYDPITNGHLDVITRSRGALRRGRRRRGQPAGAQGQDALRRSTSGSRSSTTRRPTSRTCAIEPFDTLVVDFALKIGAKTIVKGLRAISDFEYEFEMNQLNRMQAPDIESLYLMASPQYSFLSSSGIKELAMFGGKIDDLVTPKVAQRLKEELAR